MTPRTRVLVTTSEDLAASDAMYWRVKTGLDQLSTAAEKAAEERKEGGREVAWVPIAGAVASALPSVLSLFAARRTVTSSSFTVTDIAATAAVAGELLSRGSIEPLHDDFRLLEPGPLEEEFARLSTARQKLISKKLELERARSQLDAELTSLRERIEQFTKALADATDANETARLDKLIEEARAERKTVTQSADVVAARMGLIDSVISAIDSFTTAVNATPEGAQWSPLEAASRREQLHEPNGVSHVLLIKAASGSTLEAMSDKTFGKDKFSALATLSLTYMLLDVNSGLVAAGNASGEVDVTGSIGNKLKIEVG